MRGLAPKLLALAAALAALLALAGTALAAPAVNGIFKTKSELSQNGKITAGPNGNVWFTQEGANDVAQITPGGVITEFELPGIENPIGIAAGPEGRLWVVGIEKATSFLPSDPKGTEQSFKSNLINADANIVFAPDGKFWVASNEKVAKFSPSDFTGTIKEVKLTGTLNPKDIDVAGSLVVIADSNATEKRIVTFTSADAQKDVAIKGGSQGVAGGPSSGQFAYSDPAANPEESGLVTPPSPASSFELLGDPFGVAYGSDQAFWIVNFAAGGLTRLTSTGSHSFLPGLPKEAARQIAAGPGNTLWVTLPKPGEPAIARVTGLELPVSPPPPPGPIPPTTTPPAPAIPNTVLGKKPKSQVRTKGKTAQVKFSFSAIGAAVGFECSLAHKVKPKGKAKAKGKGRKAHFAGGRFKSCKSPQTYTLKPGSYRFQVRAIGTGGRDRSPAKYNFKVIHVAGK